MENIYVTGQHPLLVLYVSVKCERATLPSSFSNVGGRFSCFSNIVCEILVIMLHVMFFCKAARNNVITNAI